jgi:hypothetical protein
MRKFITIVFGLALLTNVTFAQGVSDKAVIPVAVTLNSILRLNIVSGGNIDFAFNNLMDYQNGIENSSAYDTRFTVASSQDFNVNMVVEDDVFIGTDYADTTGGAHTMPLNNVGYSMEYTGTGGAAGDYTFPAVTPEALSSGQTTIVAPAGASIAGPVTKNDFTIHWECGTQVGGMNGQSFLQQNLAADRYTTNVFLVLSPN